MLSYKQFVALNTDDSWSFNQILQCPAHSHKVSGSMRSRYGVVVRGTLIARDFYTSGRK
jgi:hypothetical protein